MNSSWKYVHEFIEWNDLYLAYIAGRFWGGNGKNMTLWQKLRREVCDKWPCKSDFCSKAKFGVPNFV